MDLYCLKLFIDAAKTLNFTKVAEDFYTSQPAVSRRLGDLEKELGYRLFHRGNHGVSLTKEAELFLPFAKRAIDSIDSGITTLNAYSQASKRNITIVSMTPMTSSFLPPIIGHYMSTHNDVEINIVRMFSKQIRESLSEGGIHDIYIGEESDITVNKAWVKTIIKTNHLGLVVNSNSPLSSTDDIQSYMQKNHPMMLSFEDAPALTGNARKILSDYGVDQSMYMEVNPIESIMFNIAAGIGYTLMPDNPRLFKAYDLKFIPIDAPYKMNMEIAYKKSAHQSVHEFAKAVIDFVRANEQ